MENGDHGAGPGRVAFLGLGIMGSPMAANLARAGFELAVWTRTGEKAERFAAEHGTAVAASPAEAAEGAGTVITMVLDAPEVEAVLLGEAGAAGRPRARRALHRHVHDRAQRGARGSASGCASAASPSWTRRSPGRGPRPRRAR